MTTALFSFEAWAQTEECVEAPSCTELGYTRTEDECPTGSVKCPWNTGLVYCECGEDYKYACDGDNEKAGDSQCNGLYAACSCADGYKWENGGCVIQSKVCEIGSIYYEDGTCSAPAAYTTSKTVLGIVVYVTDGGQHGQIIAPWWIDEYGRLSDSPVGMAWGSDYRNILELPNITSTTQAEADFDSCGNTDKIAAAGNASDYPAAWATRKYVLTTETAGKWCLPAAGVLRNIQKNWSAIGTAVNKVGGVSNLGSYSVWSSSEYAATSAWYATLNDSDLNYDGHKSYTRYVFPVLEF